MHSDLRLKSSSSPSTRPYSLIKFQVGDRCGWWLLSQVWVMCDTEGESAPRNERQLLSWKKPAKLNLYWALCHFTVPSRACATSQPSSIVVWDSSSRRQSHPGRPRARGFKLKISKLWDPNNYADSELFWDQSDCTDVRVTATAESRST